MSPQALIHVTPNVAFSASMNLRMPFMPFNWAVHSARTKRLTREERGLYDEIRTELWTVEGARMPLEIIKDRLLLQPVDDPALARLFSQGLLKEVAGLIFDEVQVYEYAAAVEKGIANKANGSRGGRPKTAKPAPAAALPPDVA